MADQLLDGNLDGAGNITASNLNGVFAFGVNALDGSGDTEAPLNLILVASGTSNGQGTLSASALSLICSLLGDLDGSGDLAATFLSKDVLLGPGVLSGSSTLAAPLSLIQSFLGALYGLGTLNSPDLYVPFVTTVSGFVKSSVISTASLQDALAKANGNQVSRPPTGVSAKFSTPPITRRPPRSIVLDTTNNKTKRLASQQYLQTPVYASHRGSSFPCPRCTLEG